MTNRNKTIDQKQASEINKEIWLIRNAKGTIIERCRTKIVADKILNKLNKEEFEVYTLDRDNSYREK